MNRLVRPGIARFFAVSVFAALLSGCQPSSTDRAGASRVATIGSGSSVPVGTLVALVRHAEKVDDSQDPELSPEGMARSAELARMLADADFDHIWSTDYARTRNTAAPVAASAMIDTEFYDPSDLPAFAAMLTDLGGRHLVVGHSNTTPDVVTALGGDPGSPIDDAEYDRLYLVHIDPDGIATTTLIRFGSPFGN